MRLSDLLGKDVVTGSGRSLGRVHDVRLVQDGPLLPPWGAAFRVHELAVGRRSLGTRLGYDRGDVTRPAAVTDRYQDVYGRTHTEQAETMFARVVQHGIDHLDGKPFIYYLSMGAESLLKPRLMKIAETYGTGAPGRVCRA